MHATHTQPRTSSHYLVDIETDLLSGEVMTDARRRLNPSRPKGWRRVLAWSRR